MNWTQSQLNIMNKEKDRLEKVAENPSITNLEALIEYFRSAYGILSVSWKGIVDALIFLFYKDVTFYKLAGRSILNLEIWVGNYCYIDENFTTEDRLWVKAWLEANHPFLKISDKVLEYLMTEDSYCDSLGRPSNI